MFGEAREVWVAEDGSERLGGVGVWEGMEGVEEEIWEGKCGAES